MAAPRGALPAATREAVLRSCGATSGLMLLAGTLARGQAWPTGAGTAETAVLHLGVAVGAAASVTAARSVLLQKNRAFRDATDRSNAQVLPPVAQNPCEVAFVCLAPAAGEEMLFRNALVPAIAWDWRGVVIAGSVFGALHLTGGRNFTFAAWAAAVGCAYGAALLVTGDGNVPIVAHAIANAASAYMWIQEHPEDVRNYHHENSMQERKYKNEVNPNVADGTGEDQTAKDPPFEPLDPQGLQNKRSRRTK
uniref:CAAX prenyl protease 2/Lysostaphin resistance protein A-like domain-containing protein n=1 Tax=Picocystis salinarum TaxID=88271 RepID=A0A7S3UFA3_9CHLO